MKTALLAASTPLPTQRTASAQPADEAIHALIHQLTEAWNRNDATAWAREFVDDPNFINVRGDLVQGRAAIEKIHAFIFRGPYQGSHCTIQIESIRYPAPNVALVETLSEVTHFQGLPPGLVETAPGLLRSAQRHLEDLRRPEHHDRAAIDADSITDGIEDQPEVSPEERIECDATGTNPPVTVGIGYSFRFARHLGVIRTESFRHF
jgi:uncharacterized protein (TIGR02246 family)